jgi:histone acetyltransferase (RNA polymerase elongator complex component)
MYKNGGYEPLNLDEAVFRAKEIKKIFDVNNIEILRMGLCSSDDVNLKNAENIIGAYHPAFGELVESEIIYDKLVDDIKKNSDKNIIIYTYKKNMSKVVGHKRKNIERLKTKFPDKNIKIIENNDTNLYKIEITES